MEKVKDLGQTIMGKGREVEFKNEVEKYADANSVSTEKAKSILLQERLKLVKDDIDMKGALSSDSVEDFTAALKEMFSREDIEDFKKNADNPAVFTTIPSTPVSVTEISKMEKDFKNRFDKKAPKTRVIKDAAEKTKEMYQLLERFGTDHRVTASSDIESIIRSNPELAADLGKFLQTREGVDKHDRKFGSELEFEKSWDNAKKNGEESIKRITLSAKTNLVNSTVKECLRVFKSGQRFSAAMNMATSFASFGLEAGTRILVTAKDLGVAGYKYGQKKRN